MSKSTKMVASQSRGTKTTQKKVSSTPGGSKTSSTISQQESTKKNQSKSTVVKTQKNLEKNLENLTTSRKQPKKIGKTSTSQKAKVKKPLELKVINSRKIELFPWVETFPIFLQDETENKKCWFTCTDHAQKYIDRYKSKYRCYQYTGK